MYLAIILTLFSFATFAADRFTSAYTSLANCRVIEVDDESGGFRSVCPGRDRITVYIDSGDARSWLVLKRNNVTIDLYEILLNNSVGAFPMVNEGNLEWRYKNGVLHALIVRMNGSEPETGMRTLSRLVVIRVRGTTATAIGAAQSNVGARRLADASN